MIKNVCCPLSGIIRGKVDMDKNLSPLGFFYPTQHLLQGIRLWCMPPNLVPRRQAIKKLVTVTSNLRNLLHSGDMPS